jgi:predicted DNA-binding transcriptional regulator AlpA
MKSLLPTPPTPSDLHARAEVDDPLLDPKAAAEYLGLSVLTLADLRCKGGSPIFCRAGRLIRYRKSSLDSWVDSRSYSSTSEYRRGA